MFLVSNGTNHRIIVSGKISAMMMVANTWELLIIVFEYFRNVYTITDQYIQHRCKKALVKCIISALAGPLWVKGTFRMAAKALYIKIAILYS